MPSVQNCPAAVTRAERAFITGQTLNLNKGITVSAGNQIFLDIVAAAMKELPLIAKATNKLLNSSPLRGCATTRGVCSTITHSKNIIPSIVAAKMLSYSRRDKPGSREIDPEQMPRDPRRHQRCEESGVHKVLNPKNHHRPGKKIQAQLAQLIHRRVPPGRVRPPDGQEFRQHERRPRQCQRFQGPRTVGSAV